MRRQARGIRRPLEQVSEGQLAPGRRPPQQIYQHLLSFGTGIGRLRSHYAILAKWYQASSL